MQKVLYISSNNPWGIGGGSIATGAYLDAFSQIFNDRHIDLCICEEFIKDIPNDWYINNKHVNVIGVKPRPVRSKLLSIFNGEIHRFGKVIKSLLTKEGYDYCIFDRNDTAGTLINRLAPHVKPIVIHHNFEQQYFKDNTSLFFWSIFRHHIIRGEKMAFRNAFLNIFLTKEDEEQFIRTYGNYKGKNTCLGLFRKEDVVDGYIKPLKENQKTIAITGSLNNVQNTDGIQYFINQLYPHIDHSYHIIIAGQNPNDIVLSLIKDKPNIELIANPPSMDSILRRAGIYICPTRLGSGIKVRIMDALKYGIPIIAHEVSARGYSLYIEEKVFFKFKDADEFKKSLINLEKRIENGDIINSEIREIYYRQQTLSNTVKILSELI